MLKPKLDSSSKDEGELSAAKRLLHQLHQQHRHFADVIVYDALACNAPWINAVKLYNMPGSLVYSFLAVTKLMSIIENLIAMGKG